MSKDTRPPIPPAWPYRAIARRFLRETAHLGPDGRRRVLAAIAAAYESRKARLEASIAIEKARRPMDALEFTERQARAYIARNADLTPVDRADGPIYWKYPGQPGDYQLFIVHERNDLLTGASRHLMVHRTTGEVHDLGMLGE